MKILIVIFFLTLSLQARAQSVKSFDPAAPMIPSNTLRFYLTFDRPARGLVHQSNIKLLDSKNQPIENVLMDFGQELWSPDGKRLTVLFDPGKVKRGVEASHSELTPLKDGESYKVTLGRFQHSFRVGPAIREKIDPATWTISAASAPAESIAIKFDRVMDSALLEDQLEVKDDKGNSIFGRMRAIGGGVGAVFTPSRALKKGTYQIQVSSILEDVAGNRLGEALDHSPSDKGDESSGFIKNIVVR